MSWTICTYLPLFPSHESAIRIDLITSRSCFSCKNSSMLLSFTLYHSQNPEKKSWERATVVSEKYLYLKSRENRKIDVVFIKTPSISLYRLVRVVWEVVNKGWKDIYIDWLTLSSFFFSITISFPLCQLSVNHENTAGRGGEMGWVEGSGYLRRDRTRPKKYIWKNYQRFIASRAGKWRIKMYSSFPWQKRSVRPSLKYGMGESVYSQ